ncbi:CYTH domain-containing protein [Virgibacillus flavescens]|uniref:CYTH domain-containing protein n=1 Tax=Virgibacillus flavescens TaxID=1611422 RepID=UPI003D345541
MVQEIEIEYKNLLTEEEFKQLLTIFPFPESGIWQTNHYFETKNFALKEKGAALRIREKNGAYVLTLKEPHPEGLLESHDALSEEEAQQWLAGTPVAKSQVVEQLHSLNVNLEDLVYYGKLATERYELNYQDTLLVLDYSVYNGIYDYELEIEAQSKEAGQNMLYSLLHQHGIVKKETPNKIKRFFASFTVE